MPKDLMLPHPTCNFRFWNDSTCMVLNYNQVSRLSTCQQKNVFNNFNHHKNSDKTMNQHEESICVIASAEYII